MSDRLENTTTQEAAETGSESAVSDTAETETLAAADPDESTTASTAESEPVVPSSTTAEAADTAPAEVTVDAASEAEANGETGGDVAGAEAAVVVEPAADSEATTVEVAASTEEAEKVAAESEATSEAPAVVEASSETQESDAVVEASSETQESDAVVEASSETQESDAVVEASSETQKSDAVVEAAADSEEAAAATDQAAAATDQAAEAEETTSAPSLKAETGEAMAELEKAKEDKKLVKGQVIGWNKGGYHVAIGKIAAFCPVSQIEIGNPRGPKRYLDKTFSFRVIEIQNGGRRVVLSRAEAIKAEREQRAALVRELLQPGAELEGRVSSLTNFGAFVDLGGGIEGLVHVSEISRRRVEHPKEALRNGQKVKVSVLKIEKGGQRISLSIKRLEPDPWKGVADRFPAGSTFSGTILRQTEFGLFVEVEPGLEGLVHTSRLALGQSLTDESLEVGKKVEGWVHEVESKRRRLSLSLREVSGGNPWQGVGDRYPVGELAKGIVERLASFGVFIQLEPGLTGLLPFSLLGGAAGNPRRQYHVGKEVSIRVLSIDRDKRRISLGTESSKAEGNQQDYREYIKAQSRRKETSSGLNAMASAFAKLKEQQSQEA